VRLVCATSFYRGTHGRYTADDQRGPGFRHLGSIVYGAESAGTAAVLLRPSAITHHMDAGLRWIKLPIVTIAGNDVTIRAPSTRSVAPPGPYMLFLLNAAGVPSVAQFITLA
jgi:hypothetical protein